MVKRDNVEHVQARNDAYVAGYLDGKHGRERVAPEGYSYDYDNGYEVGRSAAERSGVE